MIRQDVARNITKVVHEETKKNFAIYLMDYYLNALISDFEAEAIGEPVCFPNKSETIFLTKDL